MIPAEANSAPAVSISNEPSSLSVNHSITALTMNGTNRNSTPSVRIAGTNSATRISQPSSTLSTENTIATTNAEATPLIFTVEKIRDSSRTVAVSVARCSSVYMSEAYPRIWEMIWEMVWEMAAQTQGA